MGLWDKVRAQLNIRDGGKTFKNPQGPARPVQGPRIDSDALIRALQQQARGASPAQRNVIAAQIRAASAGDLPTAQNMMPTNPVARVGQRVINTAMDRRVAPVATGIARSGQGTLEALSGLYDLATPGKGNNRVTKALQRQNEALDRAVKDNRYNQLAYRGAQGLTDVATFLAAGAPFLKGAEKSAAVAARLPGAGQVARGVNTIGQYGPGGKTVAAGLRYLGQPVNVANMATDTLLNTGMRSARGKDVGVGTALQDAALSAGTGMAIAGAGTAIKKGSAPAVRALKEANLVRPANLNPREVAILNAFQTQRGSGGIMDDTLYKQAQAVANKAKLNLNNPGNIDELLGAFRTYETKKGQVKQFLDERASLGLGTKAVDASGKPIVRKPTPYAAQEYVPPAEINKRPTRTDFADESKLNTGRLNLDEQQRAQLGDETIQVIDRLSNDDVQKLAKQAGLDTKTYTIDQTKQKIAQQLNVRQDAVRLMNEAKAATNRGDKERLILQAAEQGRVTRSQGTDLARQLQARRIIANELDTPEMRIFKLLDEAGVNPEVYAKRLADVDFNNPKAVVKAYRDMVPAKFGNWLDTVRYNSMLSSPLTQAVNIFGNAQNVALVAPIEKTLRGTIDAIGGLFGNERKFAAGEGAGYIKGTATNIRNASQNFVDALKGTGKYANTDLSDSFTIPLAQGGAKGAAYNTLSAPMRVLDGFDKFFRTLAEGGEEGALKAREKAGIAIRGNRSALKEAEAKYRVFQTELGEPGQGVINNAFDEFAKLAMRGRSSKNPVVSTMSKFTIPFVKTVNNIAKQGIVDYSPLGLANLPGNADKTTAITRAIMGSAVFGTAAAMVEAGDVTWAEPRDAEERARFRAEGRQPYAIRIGGKWFNFSKLTPSVAFPIAMTAAMDDALKNKKIGQDGVDSILEAVSKYGNFLADQSYAKSVGDALGSIGGDKEAVARSIGNNIQQVIPFRALSGWIARIGDNLERKVDTSQSYVDQQVESLMQQIPGLRENTTTRDYKGVPIAANKPVFNGLSPVRVTEDRGVNPLDAEADKLKQTADAGFKLGKGDVAKLDKIAMPEVEAAQKQLLSDPRYQKLSSKEKQAKLQSVKDTIYGARKAEYMANNSLGEYAGDFTGDRKSKLSTAQKRVLQGKSVDFIASTDNNKTYSEKLNDAITEYDTNQSTMSRIERQKAETSIKSLQVKSQFPSDVIELYGLGSKQKVYDFISSDPNGTELAKQMLAYGDALVQAGLTTKNKFRDKNGNISIQPAAKSAKSSRLPRISVSAPKAFTVKGIKSPKAAKRKSYNIRVGSKKTKKIRLKV